MSAAASGRRLEVAAAEGGPLLLFMPHCDRALYERVLAANLGPPSEELSEARRRQLERVVIIGNSFRVYAYRDEMRLVPKGAPGAAREMDWLPRLQPLPAEEAIYVLYIYIYIHMIIMCV